MSATTLSDLLRQRLEPEIFHVGKPSSVNSGFTKISVQQWIHATVEPARTLATEWSVAPTMCTDLIAALQLDLNAMDDPTLPLRAALARTADRLRTDWQEAFNGFRLHDGKEGAANASSFSLTNFVVRAFQNLEQSFATGEAPLAILSKIKLPPASANTCIVDNSIQIRNNPRHLLAIEDKRYAVGPPAIVELCTRGVECGRVELEIGRSPDFPLAQPNWWLIANKGAMYAAEYQTDWVIFQTVNVFCVGYCSGTHFFWSPIYNRRQGQEVTPPEAQSLVYPGLPTTQTQPPQRDIPLLLLAVLLKSLMDGGHATWLIPLFPRLSTFRFPDAPTRLNPKDFTNSGRRRGVEDSGPESGDQHGSGNEGEGGSEGKGNSSNEDSGSNYSDTHRAGVISLSPSPSDPPASTTTIYAGSLRIRGLSQGELARSHGYSLRVTHFLAAGVDGLVYAGVLSQGGSRKSEVAIKVSEDPQVIREEYQNYLRLSGPLDQHIPRCYGVVSAAGATFLVTALVTNRSPAAPWTVAQRGAVYQMLQAMHDAGWSHNDIVDSANSVIHNVLWDTHGRPVLIDFVTAAPHLCRGKNCPELKATQRVLRLSQHAIDIWARGIVRKSALN